MEMSIGNAYKMEELVDGYLMIRAAIAESK